MLDRAALVRAFNKAANMTPAQMADMRKSLSEEKDYQKVDLLMRVLKEKFAKKCFSSMWQEV